jgi:hypothetical protein
MAESGFSSFASNEYDIERVSDELLPRQIQIQAPVSEGLNLLEKLRSYIWT